MAHVSLVLAGLAGISYVIFWILNQLVTAHRYRARAREWGCQEPILETHKLPFNIDLVQTAMQADKEKLFPDLIFRRAQALGVYTWRYYLFGARVISTHEPKNIQTILANSFGTFDLGPQRRGLVSGKLDSWKKELNLLTIGNNTINLPQYSSGLC